MKKKETTSETPKHDTSVSENIMAEADKLQAIKANTDPSPLDLIRKAQETIKAQTDALIGQLQRELQGVATTVKTLREVTGKDVLIDPAFGQALDELGLILKSSTTATPDPKATSKGTATVAGSPAMDKIIDALKKSGKPMTAEEINTAVGGNLNTTRNYCSRAAKEALVKKIGRGVFAL